jgi:hypothetical protein
MEDSVVAGLAFARSPFILPRAVPRAPNTQHVGPQIARNGIFLLARSIFAVHLSTIFRRPTRGHQIGSFTPWTQFRASILVIIRPIQLLQRGLLRVQFTSPKR